MARVKEEEYPVIEQFKDIILKAADEYGWDAAVIAAIGSRESRWGFALDENMKGDAGHGHGYMQIDDRSFGPWLNSHDWQDAETNITMGVKVLEGKYQYLKGKGVPEFDLVNYSIGAYNCGEGNSYKSWRLGESYDKRTTGHDYVTDVMDRAAQIVSKGIFPLEDEGDANDNDDFQQS